MSAFIEFPALDPINYGYNDDGRILMPVMYCKEGLPADYPGPCSCLKSSRKTDAAVVLNIPCSFCKCKSIFKNPFNN